jgi:hypothetical protein
VNLAAIGSLYRVWCNQDRLPIKNMTCNFVSRFTVELTQTGTVGLKGYDVTGGLRFFVHGPAVRTARP